MTLLTVFYALTLAVCAHGATLRIIRASSPMPWSFSQPLAISEILCPDDVFPDFTVECVPSSSSVDYASFYVNGVVFRKESYPPYVLTGDTGGVASAWKDRPSEATIKCMFSTGESVQSTILFSCDDKEDSVLADVETFSRPYPSSSLTPRPIPSVVLEGPAEQTKDSKRGCVSINAKRYIHKSGPWEVDGDGMTYMKGIQSRKTTKAGIDYLEYVFVAPMTARYAFTLDVKTRGGVDHNDVWVEFPAGGWRLTRPGSMISYEGWTKAYHNKNGREMLAYSVDFNPHAFSTGMVLSKGGRYVVRVAGRSTQVTLYGLLFFPCYGDGCMMGGLWNTEMNKCIP